MNRKLGQKALLRSVVPGLKIEGYGILYVKTPKSPRTFTHAVLY